MKSQNNIVITGPPCSGKSTIMRELSALGYQTVPEASRMIINRWQIESDDDECMSDVADKKWFQDMITRKRISSEISNGIGDDSMLILDRSLIDNIAYRNYLGVTTDEKLKRISQDRYGKILFLKGLPLEQDGVRYESEGDQEKLSHIIEQTYQNNGYNLPEENFIEVDTIEHRLQSIVERLE